jgi:hypothetical protein
MFKDILLFILRLFKRQSERVVETAPAEAGSVPAVNLPSEEEINELFSSAWVLSEQDKTQRVENKVAYLKQELGSAKFYKEEEDIPRIEVEIEMWTNYLHLRQQT